MGLDARGCSGDIMSVGVGVLMVRLAVCKMCLRKECNAVFIAVDKAVRSGDVK